MLRFVSVFIFMPNNFLFLTIFIVLKLMDSKNFVLSNI